MKKKNKHKILHVVAKYVLSISSIKMTNTTYQSTRMCILNIFSVLIVINFVRQFHAQKPNLLMNTTCTLTHFYITYKM